MWNQSKPPIGQVAHAVRESGRASRWRGVAHEIGVHSSGGLVSAQRAINTAPGGEVGMCSESAELSHESQVDCGGATLWTEE